MSNSDWFLDLESIDLTPNQRPAGDHFAHASGRICRKCDRPIEAYQPARRATAAATVAAHSAGLASEVSTVTS